MVISEECELKAMWLPSDTKERLLAKRTRKCQEKPSRQRPFDKTTISNALGEKTPVVTRGNGGRREKAETQRVAQQRRGCHPNCEHSDWKLGLQKEWEISGKRPATERPTNPPLSDTGEAKSATEKKPQVQVLERGDAEVVAARDSLLGALGLRSILSARSGRGDGCWVSLGETAAENAIHHCAEICPFVR